MAEYKMGPFLCEWCSTPMDDCRGMRAEGSVLKIVGWCKKCNGVLWSKSLHLPVPPPNNGLHLTPKPRV